MADDAPDSGAAPGRSGLEGRIVAGGARTRARFAEMAGLPGSGLPYDVRSAAWLGNHPEISFSVGDGREVTFLVQRYAEGMASFIHTPLLAVSYRGPSPPLDLGALMRDAMPARLAGLGIEDLAEVFLADPDLGRPGLPMPPRADSAGHPSSLLNSWGVGDAYADFFASGEIARGQLDSLDFYQRCSFIQHCDHECTCVSPQTGVPMVPVINYPWDERTKKVTCASSGWPSHRPPSGEDGPSPMCTTDLTENDVIMGSQGKLKRLLDHVVSRPQKNMIFFSCTCVPMVAGEDYESLVRRYQKKSPVPMMFLEVTPQSMTGVFRDLFVARRREAEARSEPAVPRSVNLVGFKDEPATAELKRLLERAGVSVNAVCIPNIDASVVESLPRGALSVLYPNAVWQGHYDQLVFDSRVPHISPEAPFGVEGTLRWLDTVAAALGLADRVEAVRSATAAGIGAQWERRRSEARSRRLGLVVRGQETHYLTDPAETWGVPLLRVLQEFGFGLDILILAGDRGTAHKAATAIDRLLIKPHRHELKAFNSFEMMRRRLRESKAEAFFSHHFGDWRLSEAGKASFSLQEFEGGIEGALRTLDRLLGICRTGFYSRNAQYLRRDEHGMSLCSDGDPDRGAVPPRHEERGWMTVEQ